MIHVTRELLSVVSYQTNTRVLRPQKGLKVWCCNFIWKKIKTCGAELHCYNTEQKTWRLSDILLRSYVSVLFLCYFFFFSKKNCAHDFSKTTQPISIKLTEVIGTDLNFIRNFLFCWCHFRFWEIGVLAFFRGSACPGISS